MSPPLAAPTAARSTFVTVLAWIFIALSGFNVLISLLQNVMAFLVFSGGEFDEVIKAARADANTPALSIAMLEYMHVLLLVLLLASITMLVASIGLLRRLDWARRLFIVLLALGMLANIAGFVAQFTMLPSMELPPDVPEGFGQGFRAAFIGVAVVSGFLIIGFSVLFGWIIKRLLSPQIAAEFVRTPRPA